jgi:adenylate cyclase
MGRLKQLIHEIHRRSLWQVLGIYLVGAWLCYEVIQSLTEGMGLPSWFPSLAVVLFIVGLPIVLATAFVQEGIGQAGAHGEVETTTGGTPIPRQDDTSDTTPRRLLTWKNALIGGVAAFGLWGLIATAWLLTGDRRGRSDAASGPAENERSIESIAVLAFEDMSPEGDQEYFSDGISEEILNALARIKGLRVSGRSSSFQFKGTNTGIKEVGQQLGVEAVLEGSVRKSEGRLRITAQLVSSEDGFHIWSETFDRELADVFTVQEEIANAIVAALGFQPVEEGAVGAADAQRVAAHDYYLLGLHRWHHRATETDVRAALAYFDRAVEADSLYAAAWAGRALGYAVLPQYGSFPAAEGVRLTRSHGARAMELDPSLAEPHAALCQSLTWMEWDWAGAEAHCRRAIELRPNDATAHQWYAELLTVAGRLDEALQEALIAEELDPLAPVVLIQKGLVYLAAERNLEAMDVADQLLEVAPGAWYVEWLAFMSRFASRHPDGLEAMFLLWAETPADSVTHSRFVEAFLAAEADEAMRQEAVELVPQLNLAKLRLDPFLYVYLDEPEAALAALEELIQSHDPATPLYLESRALEPLRRDPRFAELRRAAGVGRRSAEVD